MKTILIIFWMNLISSCFTAPVIDINLNERPKEEWELMMESLPDTVPFLSGLLHWNSQLPDFNNPSMISEFTQWYKAKVFPEMKWVTPLICEPHMSCSAIWASESRDLQVIIHGLTAVEQLLNRIKFSLVEDVASQHMPLPLHQARTNWVLVNQQYIFEKFLSSLMAASRGFFHKSKVSMVDSLRFIKYIASHMHQLKYAELIYELYKTGMTIEQKIYDDFVQIRDNPSSSIENVEQLIRDYYPLIVHYEEKKSPPRFEHIIGVKYIPDLMVEKSSNLQSSHTLPKTDGELSNVKRKRPSTEQTPTVENSKRKKLPPSDGAVLIEMSVLLKSVLAHTDVINLMLLNWLYDDENTGSIDLSRFEYEIRFCVTHWMKDIKTLLDSSSQCPEIGKSLEVAMNALGKVSTILGELYQILPEEVYENVTFIEFWKNYFSLALQHIYIQNLSSISEENILTFIKENSKIITCMNKYRALFKILSEGKTAASMIQENIITFRQQSEISTHDLQQLAMINQNLFKIIKEDARNKNSDGISMELCTQNMASFDEATPRQFGSSPPIVNIDHCIEEHHRCASSCTIGDCDSALKFPGSKGVTSQLSL